MKHALSLFHVPYLLTMHTREAMTLGGDDVFVWEGAQREVEQHRHTRLQTDIRGYKRIYKALGAIRFVGFVSDKERFIDDRLHVFMRYRQD